MYTHQIFAVSPWGSMQRLCTSEQDMLASLAQLTRWGYAATCVPYIGGVR